MTLIWAILSGSFLGSFLNVCIDRMPSGSSLVSPRSHCDNCKRQLEWYELLPIISYMALRGKCRTCGAHVPLRTILVEALTASLMGCVFAQYGFSLESFVLSFYMAILIVVFFIDLEKTLILNIIVLPATLLALGLSPLVPDVGILASVYGTLVGAGIMAGIYVLSRGGMGAGDVKLAAFMGAAVGFPLIFVALFISVVSSGLVAVGLLVTRKKGRKEFIPFGPFLVAGTVTAMFWGRWVLDAYLKTW